MIIPYQDFQMDRLQCSRQWKSPSNAPLTRQWSV